MTELEGENETMSNKACEASICSKCYVERTLDILGGKWSYLIIKHLFSGKKRFGELRKLLHNVNARSLTNCLRNLEEHEVISREIIPTVPVTVEYELTPKGEELKEIVSAMFLWGERWAD